MHVCAHECVTCVWCAESLRAVHRWGPGNQSHRTQAGQVEQLQERVTRTVDFMDKSLAPLFPAFQLTSWHGPPPLLVRTVYECILGASLPDADAFDFRACGNPHGSHYQGSAGAVRCACERRSPRKFSSPRNGTRTSEQ